MDSSRNSVNLGKYLRRVISSTRFNGLSGDFHIVNGQLQSSIFEIINGIGDGERVIGFWTKKNGFVKELNSMKKVDAGDIIWPGESTSVPKGWVIPTNGKKLRIGIPMKDGFSDFVKLIRDPSTNTIRVAGFCIDVFEAVMAALPYVVPFEYIPFAKPDGRAAGSYDELVYQVFLGNFDAVVGDVTIRANRSKYVDFALPFTESGINLIVPVKDRKAKKAWVFLKPLTWDLWVTSFCFFIFIGFVIWILEHGINEDLSGTRSHQFGTSLCVADPNTSVSSSSLGVNSFWGLFVIVGVAASFALIIFTSMLVYENRITLMRVHPVDIWKNIINRHFTTNSGETNGTNTDSVETIVRPNLSNNEEETVCNQENQNGQTSENIVSNPQVVNSS
ncbi:hypothetical protein LguiB_005567 [Lonicera macranthoides]